MKVHLLTTRSTINEMIYNACEAILICHSNPKVRSEEAMLKSIITFGHESILEHINLTFRIEKISRALLQELARHRHISLSVESTRHTLRKYLKDELWVENLADELLPCQRDLLYYLVKLAKTSDYPNDELKYYLPEFWPTNLILTSSVRELRYIMKLRSQPPVLKEFQMLVQTLFEAIPMDYRYLFEDCIYKK